MDITTIVPEMLRGTITIPPSKSVAHRAIIAAALSGEVCTIDHIAFSKDILATISCMERLGVDLKKDLEKQQIIFSGTRKAVGEELILHCDESGSTLRFLIPVALLWNRPVVFQGNGRLMQRPQKPYLDIFSKKGISCKIDQNSMRIEGALKPGKFSLPGDVSSQFVTGLLFALPLLDGDSEIEITTEMESKGYLDLTLSVLKDFGIQIINKEYRRFIIAGNQRYSAKDYNIEGDYSQAAFFLVAGAIGCDVRCYGLNPDSLQGDKKILDILTQVGARVERFPDGSVQAYPSPHMRGIEIDAREIPDLVPILAVLCGFCEGESKIINAGRLRMKESDRLAAVASELGRLGLDIQEGMDYLKIQGVQTLHGETVSAWNDHRIAMSLAIAACRCEGPVVIDGGKVAVKKSYPDFFEVYESLQNGPVTLVEFGQVISKEREG